MCSGELEMPACTVSAAAAVKRHLGDQDSVSN
jgi:hypothetical protein